MAFSVLRIGVASAGLAALLAGGCWQQTKGPSVQGWTSSERADWYWQSQGSRLVPYKWFLALEQPGGTGKFSDEAFLKQFGHLPASPEYKGRLPVGFAIDRQPDEEFVAT